MKHTGPWTEGDDGRKTGDSQPNGIYTVTSVNRKRGIVRKCDTCKHNSGETCSAQIPAWALDAIRQAGLARSRLGLVATEFSEHRRMSRCHILVEHLGGCGAWESNGS